jgi:hypothetical protein
MSDTKRGLSHAAVDLLLRVVETPNALIAGPVLTDYYRPVANQLQTHGLLVPDGYEAATTSLADHDDVPVSVTWSAEAGGYGYFSASAGWIAVPTNRLNTFRVSFNQLFDRVLARLDLSTHVSPTSLRPDVLWEVGEVRLPGRSKRVSLWIGRRLADPKVWNWFCDTVRARPAPGLRIVLSLTPADRLPAQILQGHSIIAVRDIADQAGSLVVDPNLLAARVASGTQQGDGLISIAADGASVMVRGQRYVFSGSKQRAIIRHLYEAWHASSADCLTAEVLQHAGYMDSVNTLRKAFSRRTDWRDFIAEKNGRCWMFL